MSDRNSTQEIIVPAGHDTYSIAAPAAEPSASPVAEVARILRGRYIWALALSAVFASVGAFAGATLPKPTYMSHGVIEIAPKVPKVLYDSEEKGMLPMFDSYIFSQAAIAGGRRVIDMAMQSDAWKQLGRGSDEAELARFQAGLGVGHSPRTQLIDISFTDEDPTVAVTAVNEVIRAYMRIVEERDSETGLTRVHALEKRRTLDNGRLAELRSEMLAATDGLGEEAVESSYSSMLSKVTKYEEQLRDIDMQLVALKAASSVAAPVTVESTDAQLAENDATLNALLQQRAGVEDQILHMREINGWGPEHPSVVQARGESWKRRSRLAPRKSARGSRRCPTRATPSAWSSRTSAARRWCSRTRSRATSSSSARSASRSRT
jgi:uncharacterized protein involved in exopolysaccharide biosynthesis